MLKIKPKIEKIKKFFIFEGPIEKSWAVGLVVALSITTCSASTNAGEIIQNNDYGFASTMPPYKTEYLDELRAKELEYKTSLISDAQSKKELYVSSSGSPQLSFVRKAMQYKNTGTWVFGGSTPAAWDCSGFIVYVAKKSIDTDLYHSATAQMESGFIVEKPIIGDLVGLYYRNTSTMSSHVGIYVGNGNFIHVSETRGTVVDPVSNYENKYDVRYSRFIEKEDNWTAEGEVGDMLKMKNVIDGMMSKVTN